LYARTASTLDGRFVTFSAPATNITTPRIILAASPSQSRHPIARHDVAADTFVVAEVGTRKEYRPPLCRGSVRTRVFMEGPCDSSGPPGQLSRGGLGATSPRLGAR
jgi:hypothetical protein